MVKKGFLSLFSLTLFVSDMRVQGNSSCKLGQITIRDPVTGSIQCQDCLKCPPGEGLSVNCGDVITPSTPVQCKPCVLGETFSASFSAAACEDCGNCGEYRETTKACTVTSKAVCGGCKPGAYAEGMLGLCKPCSPCCNDGKDIIRPECQVSGVPTVMQCSYLRSDKCSALMTSSMITTQSTSPPDQSTTPWRPPPSTISTEVISFSSEPVSSLIRDASPNEGIIAGSFLFVVATNLVIACYKVMRKHRKAPSMRIGVVPVETGAGLAQNHQHGNDKDDEQVNQKQTGDRVSLPPEGRYEDSPFPLPTQEEAADNDPEKIGVQETASPLSRQRSLDSKLDGSVVKQCTELSKERAYSAPSIVTRKTTVTMSKVTDEKVTPV